MGAGPLGVPSANPGVQANAVSDLRIAIEQLQKLLPDFPVGTEQHKAVLNAIKSLSVHAPAASEVPGQQNVAMRNLMANAGKNANIQQLMRSAMSGAGGASPGGTPGQIPGTSSPGAAGMAGGGGIPPMGAGA